MKQVFFRRGEVIVDEVPPPAAEAGCVVVRTAYSCVSPGTEVSSVRATGKPLWERALTEPDNLRKVVAMAANRGIPETLRSVRERVDTAHPAGYSAAGTVIAAGEGVADLRVGDAVACAGAQCAFHAELIRVPRNLCVPVPAGLPLAAAATVTLGAIALQGVRRAQPTLGETFAVIGLGLLGQLTAQLLKANGCRVIGLDIDADRVQLALSLGADLGVSADEAAALEAAARLTGGQGVDGAIVTASGSSSEIMALAFRLCRKKGRVVLVGDVGLDLDRADIYDKELDFLVSTSYGPGRYDRLYEEDGLDYPIGYVRWTENRNMAEYLALLAAGRVRVEPLIGVRHRLDDAPAAYSALKSGSKRPLAALLEYSADDDAHARRRVATGAMRAAAEGKLRLALVGAGSFVRGSHVPALRALGERYVVQAVMSRTGHHAKELAVNTGAAYASTDYEEILADAGIDAVLIGTRHDLHAGLALKALQAGKHVLVEKPLALTPDEARRIEEFYSRAGDRGPVLLTGFNRRFSRHARALRELIAASGRPAMLDYRMNAGYLPPEHWIFSAEGGGRNLGEACHIYDLFTYLTDARARSVEARSAAPRDGYYRADDNFTVLVDFDDGSVATLLYTAMGDARAPKEQLEAYFDGKVARLGDYRGEPDKGLREELEAFHAAASGRAPWPIPLWQQLQACDIAFRVERALSGTRAGA